MTVCLVMIIRDEAAGIVRCLDAAKAIANSVLLIDTGSEDGTQAYAREWARVNDISLTLIEEPWENFQVNRSSLLRHAREQEADWFLMLDADLVVHAPDPLPDLENADCWQGWVKFSGLDYTLPFLVRASKPWRYEGVAHAYLTCDESFDEATMDELWVEDYSHTTIEKLERDLAALSAEHARNPLHPRTTFYLAQTYYDLGRFHEAIQFYRARAYMDSGWDEEQYYAAYRLGALLCEHVSFSQGAKELLRAWEMRPQRTEALRVLSNVSANVADKIPKPPDRLFVHNDAYVAPPPSLNGHSPEPPPFPEIGAGKRRRPRVTKLRGLDPRDVSAVIVTRGNVDLAPTLTLIPFDDVVIWNNAERAHDYKAFGRYAAIPETKNPVIFWVDDDVVFTAFDRLLNAYEPGKLVCNMDQNWVDGAGYEGVVGMQGAGSLCDASLPEQVWARYLAEHAWDDDALVEADFVFGTLAPFTRIDIGFEVREFSGAADRLWTQQGQTERKWKIINRCRAMLEQVPA